MGKAQEHKSVDDIRKDYDIKIKKADEKKEKFEELIDDYIYKHQK